MTSTSPLPAVNLTNCDREPIHVPGSIQTHGCLLVFAPLPSGELVVTQASENAASFLGLKVASPLGATCTQLFGHELNLAFCSELEAKQEAQSNHFLRSLTLPAGRQIDVITHFAGGRLVAEFETRQEAVNPDFLNTTIVNVVAQLEASNDVPALGRALTREIRRLTGFDRILLYSFDDEGVGTVIAEDGNGNLPTMLHLRFPGSDIPQQARRLYLLNRLRIIPDVEYTPSPLIAADGSAPPFDMTYCVLRSVSPIHRDYMRNMGTASSMSISVVIDGALWGMISCHHATPRTVPFIVRSACDVLARVVAAQISAHSRSANFAEAIRLKAIERDLLTYMALEENYLDGLTNHPEKVLELTKSSGAALILNDTCVLMGETPSEHQVKMIAEWLVDSGKPDLFASDHLLSEFQPASGFTDKACGLLAISLSQVHRFRILWFRPEIIRTVQWAGEPASKLKALDGTLQISPRESFASWSEMVRDHSEAWSPMQIEAARDFRNAMLLIVLRRAEELADMAAELEFTNKELEAFSYSVSHDLRAPFRHISGFAELLLDDESENLSDKGKRYLTKISDSAQFAGLLVDSLLNFSHIARTRLDQRSFAMEHLVREVWDDVVAQESQGRKMEFHCGPLPEVEGDVQLLRQVWRNLLSNAVKYTRMRDVGRVDIQARQDQAHYIFSIRDNGAGFDNRYAHKLFGAFQRLHRMEEFEGTGIGLANVRRIVGRHGGQTWAEGKVNEGAVFYFSLPVPRTEEYRPV
jgi:chemotaxis family two-component system sensor kinase Cph1